MRTSRLPLEIVICRLSNFRKNLTEPIDEFYYNGLITSEDWMAAIQHVAETSGYRSSDEMFKVINSWVRHGIS